MSSLVFKNLSFFANDFYLKSNNIALTTIRNVQQQNRLNFRNYPNKKRKYFKWFIYFEIASIGCSYLLWNRMNHSQDFRLYMSKNYPMILEGDETKNVQIMLKNLY
jgi:hypothetical protein